MEPLRERAGIGDSECQTVSRFRLALRGANLGSMAGDAGHRGHPCGMSPPSVATPALTPGSVAPFARFDDFSAGTAMVFRSPHRVLETTRSEEVPAILTEVDRATGLGSWAAGFVSYEAASGLDPDLATRRAIIGEPFASLPLVWFAICGPPQAATLLTGKGDGSSHAAGGCHGGGEGYQVTPWVPGTDYTAYERKVEAVRNAIAAGDTYQCNLTLRLFARTTGDLARFYRDLALAQRARYSARIDSGRFTICSASPELFFEWAGDLITTRPMKGTAARGRWPAEDAARALSLPASEKDRAENVMIVDLMRNDLGRIAEWGSVGVPALFSLERYETVWQLTSTVTARAVPETSLLDVFRALFPCGSVTGAPKRRTMELIASLEDTPRGVYCGAIGVVAPPGASLRARFSVAIRTVVVDRVDGDAVYGTGGAITWDSDPASEFAEAAVKSAILSRRPDDPSLLETMAFLPGHGLRNVERHLGRIVSSARYFGYAADEERIAGALYRATSTLTETARVRLLLGRSGVPVVEVAPMPLPVPSPSTVPATPAAPVTLAIDLEPVSSTDVWMFHKTTRRDCYRERAARHRYADDVILVNERTEPTETTIANLVCRIEGRWWTPPVEAGCLPGVERGRLLDEGTVAERALTLQDLRDGEALAVVSSLRGWRPAVLAPPQWTAGSTVG